ncbi:MAG TPA: hypothetical protein VFC41_00665, partial [Anaerovoracaceae bacterium]|nr:hypothetical protein [Anaerovoracaceae bacterium]
MTKQCFLILMLLLSTQLLAQEADSLDNAFSNPTDLTDQERDRANNFVHQGVKDRAYTEGCKTINDCKSVDDGFPLEMMIGKAYALIGGMLSAGSGGLMPTLDKKSTPEQIQAAETANAKPGSKKVKAEKDTKNDYCMMMAMAYEAIGGMIQQSLQKQADNSTHAGDAQLQALVSLQ